MTGAELHAYLLDRLAEAGLAVSAARTAELYRVLTHARDTVRRTMAQVAPVVVKELVTLEADGAGVGRWRFPAAVADPLKVLELRDTDSLVPFEPSATLEQDTGDYVWLNTRTVRFAAHARVSTAPEAECVLDVGPITAATSSAQVGLPTPCHRAIAMLGAVLALTVDETSDATSALGLFQKEISELETLYGDFDAQGGLALRHQLFAAIGQA